MTARFEMAGDFDLSSELADAMAQPPEEWRDNSADVPFFVFHRTSAPVNLAGLYVNEKPWRNEIRVLGPEVEETAVLLMEHDQHDDNATNAVIEAVVRAIPVIDGDFILYFWNRPLLTYSKGQTLLHRTKGERSFWDHPPHLNAVTVSYRWLEDGVIR
ncbi:MAG: hypothetical protein AAF658_01030 [Myxococcota bacterium]